MTGRIVGFVVDGELVFWGTCEYTRRDGWVGIRQLDGRLDEAPASHVHLLRPDGNDWTW